MIQLRSGSHHTTTLRALGCQCYCSLDASQVEIFNLIHFFFIERYAQAYKDQLDAFVNIVMNNEKPSVSFEDGRNALILANAAYDSLNNGKSMKVVY